MLRILGLMIDKMNCEKGKKGNRTYVSAECFGKYSTGKVTMILVKNHIVNLILCKIKYIYPRN